MSLKLKNTEKYLKQYTEKLLDHAIVEISRTDRTRAYKSGVVTGPIKSTGSLQDSLKFFYSKEKNTFNIIGNEYGEAVDEGTSSSTPPVSKLINWLVSKNKT